MDERTIHQQVCDFIRYQYPKIIFNTDLSGATKLTINQARRMKRLRSSKGFPDLVIYEKRGNYGALFIELKRDGVNLLKKRIVDSYGEPAFASDHLRDQNEMMKRLREKGYKCEFAVGFDSAIKIINDYLK